MLQMLKKVKLLMIRQKMDSLSFELLSRMAHMMTRMTRMTRITHWLDSNDSLARWLAVCQDPFLQVMENLESHGIKEFHFPGLQSHGM